MELEQTNYRTPAIAFGLTCALFGLVGGGMWLASLEGMTKGQSFVERIKAGNVSKGKKTGTIDRKSFEASVIGKTGEEIIGLYGRPADTGKNWWDYDNLTIDPITGKTDASVRIRISDAPGARAESVIY